MSKPTVAILGASANRAKFGNKSIRAHLEQGYVVYPVNPRETSIEGLECYPSIASVPDPVDRVSVYLAPNVLLNELSAIAAKKPKEVWLNPGTESDAVLAKARELGLPVIQACSIVGVGSSPAEYSDT